MWLRLCHVRGRSRQSLLSCPPARPLTDSFGRVQGASCGAAHSASRVAARGSASVARAVVRGSHSSRAHLLGPSQTPPGRCRALAVVPPTQRRARSRKAALRRARGQPRQSLLPCPSAWPLTDSAWAVQGASCGAVRSASRAVAHGCLCRAHSRARQSLSRAHSPGSSLSQRDLATALPTQSRAQSHEAGLPIRVF